MKRLRFALKAALSVLFLESNFLPLFLFAAWFAPQSLDFRRGMALGFGLGGEMPVLEVWILLACVMTFIVPIWAFLDALGGGIGNEAVEFGLRNHFVKVYFVYPYRFMRRVFAL